MKIIRVKQQHIDQGNPRNGYLCPVALAIGEITQQLTQVSCSNIVLNANSLRQNSIKTPQRVKKFIGDFDTGCPVKTFSFILWGV